jgi:hypothetical protein
MASSAAAKTTIQRRAQQAATEAVQSAIKAKGDPWAGINVGILRQGQRIVLPDNPVEMSYDVAIETLERKREEEEQNVAVNESVDAFPKDGAVAFQKAMQEMFGWVSAVPTPGFFGPTPPTTIDVDIGPNEKISVVWGRFELPGVEGFVQCGGYPTPKGPRFLIRGEVKRKHHEIVRELAEITRRIAHEESIYRGKAISLTVTDEGEVDWDDGISFSDLSGVVEEELVFSETTAVQIKTSLWTLIEQTDRCRVHKVPLKRGILMEGKYGTGKSLTSAVTAKKAVANGWTFLSISRVSGLKDALNFARKFQPCVIFAEDIDRIVSGDDRSVAIDDILNTIDGIQSKGTEIMVVLTTNHKDKINKAMIRPGRLDAVIEVTPPDGPAVMKLVRLYGRSLIKKDDTLEKCSEILAGQIPAMIRECTERAKLYAIGRSDTDHDLFITDDDIYNAAIGMKSHMDLLEAKVETNRDPSFREMIEAAVLNGLADVIQMEHNIVHGVARVDNRVAGVANEISNMSGGGSDTVRRIQRTLEEFHKRTGDTADRMNHGADKVVNTTDRLERAASIIARR